MVRTDHVWLCLILMIKVRYLLSGLITHRDIVTPEHGAPVWDGYTVSTVAGSGSHVFDSDVGTLSFNKSIVLQQLDLPVPGSPRPSSRSERW